LPTLPRAHVSLEATIGGSRRAWKRSATLLQQRQVDLKHSEVSLDVVGLHSSEPHRHAEPSIVGCESKSNAMLGALTLSELVSLSESKREKSLLGSWQGEMGRVCLNFLVGLAGLSWPELPAGYTLLQHHALKFLDFRGEDGKIMKSPQACPPCPIHAFYQHRSW